MYSMFKFNTFKVAATTFSDQAETFSTALLSEKMKKCVYIFLYLHTVKGAQAWPSRVRIFLHKSDPYG